MIRVDVSKINHNIDMLDIEFKAKVTCAELINKCKDLLNLSGDGYALKQNDVFIHSTQEIQDGDSFLLTFV